MKIRSTIIVVLLFPVLINAQAFQIDKPALPIDSLKKVLPFLHDSARVDCLNELAGAYMEVLPFIHSDSVILLAKQAYADAYAINYIKGLGDACLRQGLYSQWYLWNSGEMEKHFREAVNWYKRIEDDDGLGHAFLGVGAALLHQGSPDEAKKTFEQSAFHFRKTGNHIMLAELTDQFGNVYSEKRNFEQYFESIKQGLREKKRINDNRGMIWSFYRLAHIYQSVGDFVTALDYFHQSFRQASSQSIRWKPFRSMGNIFLYLENYDSSISYFREGLRILPDDGPCLAGLGKLCMLQKEYDTALNYLQKAITNFKSRKNDGGIMWALVDMGKSYIGLKQYTKALRSARECMAMAGYLNSKDAMQYVYEIHWNIYEALQQKDSAYFYFQKFVPLKDSLEGAKFKFQYLQKLTLYKVEAKEEQQQARIDLLNKDNQIKQQQLQRQGLLKKILVGSFVTLILLSIILFRNAALKRKNEKHRRELAENELQIQKFASERTKAGLQQQATELEMQVLRSQMNPHFIFNCLSSINRFILKNESEIASDYLTKFSRLVRMVLNNSKNSLILLEDELEMLRLYLDLERLRFKNSFDYSISFHNHFDISSIFIPPLLLQPFAENAIWHGLMQKEGHGTLDVAFELDNNLLNCYISDNGVGRKTAEALKSRSIVKQKSMGMQITAGRLALLNKDAEQTTFFVEDLVDAEGRAAGTRVILKIKYRECIEEFSSTPSF
ncbi:MAG: histidine kinase [Chitinophagaceae bacterium]